MITVFCFQLQKLEFCVSERLRRIVTVVLINIDTEVCYLYLGSLDINVAFGDMRHVGAFGNTRFVFIMDTSVVIGDKGVVTNRILMRPVVIALVHGDHKVVIRVHARVMLAAVVIARGDQRFGSVVVNPVNLQALYVELEIVAELIGDGKVLKPSELLRHSDVQLEGHRVVICRRRLFGDRLSEVVDLDGIILIGSSGRRIIGTTVGHNGVSKHIRIRKILFIDLDRVDKVVGALCHFVELRMRCI